MNFIRTGMWEISTVQSFWTGAGVLWIFSAAVSAMDPPETRDSRFYGWLYRFTHLLAANLDRALGPKSVGPMPEQPEINIPNKEND
jgi:hypothetical protein